MAFISNKERAKTSARLYRGSGFRKFFILISLICGVLCTLLIVIGLLVQIGKISTDEASKFALYHVVNGKFQFTAYGYVVAVITCIAFVGGLISIILTLTMRSPKSVTRDVYKLTSSALPGKRTTKHAASEARERL